MNFFSPFARGCVCFLAGWLTFAPLQAATAVRFSQLNPEVSGAGSLWWEGGAGKTTVGTVSSFGLVSMPGGDPLVMHMGAFTSDEGLTFDTGLTLGNGGGYYINDYTMIFDIYWEESSAWYTFFNAEGWNGNDGDFFRRGSDGAIGVGGDGYFGTTTNNVWHRVALTVTSPDEINTLISIYLNGVYLGVSVRDGGLDGRFSLYLTGEEMQTRLFSDNDGDTGPAYVSQFYFDNRVYSAGEIAALGGASAAAIPEPGTIGLLLLGLGALVRRHWR